MWRGIAAAALGGHVGDISHAVESHVRCAAATSGSSRTTPATASARRCTSRPTCPTSAGPAAASRLVEGLALAVEPMIVAGEPWTARSRRRLDGRHRRRLAGRALRAHLHAHARRRLGADRPRRRRGQARRARRPLRRALSPCDRPRLGAGPEPAARAARSWEPGRRSLLRAPSGTGRSRCPAPARRRAQSPGGRRSARTCSAQLAGRTSRSSLVPHSNAGLYVAALAAARPVEAVVFVDAGLPSRRRRPRPRRRRSASTWPAWPTRTGCSRRGRGWWPERGPSTRCSRTPRRGPRSRRAAPAAAGLLRRPRCRRRRAGSDLPAAYLGVRRHLRRGAGARPGARGWPVETLPGRAPAPAGRPGRRGGRPAAAAARGRSTRD